jgi:hypothetical protein
VEKRVTAARKRKADTDYRRLVAARVRLLRQRGREWTARTEMISSQRMYSVCQADDEGGFLYCRGNRVLDTRCLLTYTMVSFRQFAAQDEVNEIQDGGV